ncbi:MAG: RNA polymerase sigma factor, partial [Lachnospiraceae bacterium]|nr:RNA polymerase sigma factor [Lachnospiraceae bacterium]
MSENKAAGRYQSYTQAVADAKAGVQEAFTYLYESTYRDKYYIAQKYMRNETDAQDVLQDAYMKAWQNLGQLQEAEKFPHWLSMIVASTALNALKKKKDLPFSALEKGTEDGDTFAFEEEDWRREYQPEQTYTDKETAELLKELMDGLSDEQRFCVLMYYVEEHSVGEIAKTIGCSENTVKSRLNYGRKNLRAKAEEMERKGYKLYGIAALPLLLWLLRKEAMAASFAMPALNTAAAAAAS